VLRGHLDADNFEEWFTDLRPCDPLQFKDRLPYAERLRAEQAKKGRGADRATPRPERNSCVGGVHAAQWRPGPGSEPKTHDSDERMSRR
jgi:hypothetical protein